MTHLPGLLATWLTCFLLFTTVGPVQAQEEEKILNVYNWSDYIADDTIRNFEKETGIKVRYDSYDNNELLHAKLVAGKTGYDIVVPGSSWGGLQIQGGLLRVIDKSKVPNLKYLDPSINEKLSKVDPGNKYLVPWLWGYTTVGINVNKVKAALGGSLPENPWDLIMKPEYISKLKSCGVSFLDSADEVVVVALQYLNRDGAQKTPTDYAAAAQLLKSVRPYVTLFSSSSYINDLASGSICVSLGWSGDINIARQRAIDGKTGQKIEALLPKTGGPLWFDTMAIPADAPHPGNAQKWIDYILRPDVNASLTNKVFYANPTTTASKKFIKPELASNPTVFLSDEDLARMKSSSGVLSNDSRRQQNRVYSAFKTGL